MDLLYALLERRVIITLAVTGAIIATIGSVMVGRISGSASNRGRLVSRIGYLIAGLSVLLFITAGFLAKS